MKDLRLHDPDPGPRDGRVLQPQALPGARRRLCRLTTLHPERGLSRAVIQHLAEEMPDIDFCLGHRADADAIWVLGYEAGARTVIRALRAEHPRALILVTMRGPIEDRGDEVVRAGADHVCGWPIPYERLSQILHRREAPAAVPHAV